MPDTDRHGARVLGAFIDAVSWDQALDRLLGWARARESRCVAICNVHVVVSASRDAAYRDVINGADMATPDGAPVAWMLCRLGFAGQPRITGPDLMWALYGRCAAEGSPVYFYGSTEPTLAALADRLRIAFPNLLIAGMESPPFRALSDAEDAAAIDRINGSGAAMVFVGLGCPKQERWMAEHRGRVHAVMIGVGAAFDFHAGTLRRAPKWMQKNGLEWLFRLLSEPRRLWKRYVVTNTLFILGASCQLLLHRGRKVRVNARLAKRA
jgi:N-acetylglucosaminyldiphosphoundecaprenol N-acetyl-beta-D-mannosaminyltransferase